MTVLQRAATIAAMTFTLAGLITNSAPSRANGLDRTAITAPAFGALNSPTPGKVPEAVPSLDAQALAQAELTDDFDSLAEAVAAQDMSATGDAERCLAGAVYFESKGEPLSGQLAVAEVIINRAKSGRFPTDVCGVVTQRGQFGFVRGGEIPAVDATRATYRTALAVAKVALADAWNSPADTALYFNTPNRRPGGALRRIAAIGNHIFYR